MDDAISRQAVLKLLSTMPPEEAMTKALLIQSVKQMDAAQPSGPDNLVKDSQGLAKDLVNDCISRKAAIKRATKDHDFYKGATTPADKARRDELLNVMCWLGELPSVQPEQRWIPCNSGRFPEESGTYTVTAYDGKTKRVTYAKYQKRLKRWELTGARAYWRVLAWMPLPEPYREVDHETD